MIMILTGKCQDDFIKYASYNYGEDSGDLAMMRSVMRNALIIEFFDSVGIYILPQLWETTMKWNYRISDKYTSDFDYESRHEATERAIIHANKIYNENKV